MPLNIVPVVKDCHCHGSNSRRISNSGRILSNTCIGAPKNNSKSLCTKILIRLLAHGYDAIIRVYKVKYTIIIIYTVWMEGLGGGIKL